MKQLKTLAALAASLACTMTMIACQNSGGSNSNNNDIARLANVPNSAQCRQSGAYNGTAWNQYSNSGFQPYGYNNTGYNGYNSYNGYNTGYNTYNTGCGVGYITICDARFGLICAPTNQYGSANIAWYGYGANTLQFYGYGYGSYGYNPYASYYGSGYGSYGWPQYPYSSGYNVGYSAGYNTSTGFYFGRTCGVGYDSCGAGKFCQPMNWSSPIGVCVKN